MQEGYASSSAHAPSGVASSGAEDVATLNRTLENAAPPAILRTAIRIVPEGKLAVVSAFGIKSAALLKLVADVEPSLPVLFLDTDWHFDETLAYRDQIVAHLGLTDVRSLKPQAEDVARADPDSTLWANDPDSCCGLRKVAPLADALVPFTAWVTGRKRYQGGERTQLPVLEADAGRLKFNPLARQSPKDISALFRSANLPRHPLADAGYASIGCRPCTSPSQGAEGSRDGRWRGKAKTECGIHVSRHLPQMWLPAQVAQDPKTPPKKKTDKNPK